MLDLVFLLILSILLSMIVVEDFRFRHIRVIWLVLLAVVVIVWKLLTQPVDVWCPEWITNVTVVFLYFLLVQVYYMLKTARWELMINRAIGLGDAVFISILALWLNPVELTVLLPLAMAFSLAGHILLHHRDSKIPLAGWMAIFFLCWGWVAKLCMIDLKLMVLNEVL